MTNIYRDLDENRFGWFHLKSMITTGMGVFTDGYDLSSIGLVLFMVLSFYGIGKNSSNYVLYISLLAGSALIGAQYSLESWQGEAERNSTDWTL